MNEDYGTVLRRLTVQLRDSSTRCAESQTKLDKAEQAVKEAEQARDHAILAFKKEEDEMRRATQEWSQHQNKSGTSTEKGLVLSSTVPRKRVANDGKRGSSGKRGSGIRSNGLDRRDEALLALANAEGPLSTKALAEAVLAPNEEYTASHYQQSYAALTTLCERTLVAKEGKGQGCSWAITPKGREIVKEIKIVVDKKSQN